MKDFHIKNKTKKRVFWYDFGSMNRKRITTNAIFKIEKAGRKNRSDLIDTNIKVVDNI